MELLITSLVLFPVPYIKSVPGTLDFYFNIQKRKGGW
jgi:hypothetical protein